MIQHVARAHVHVRAPARRYCSDQSCGGLDCTTCYGPGAPGLHVVYVDGVPHDPEDVDEPEDAPDDPEDAPDVLPF